MAWIRTKIFLEKERKESHVWYTKKINISSLYINEILDWERKINSSWGCNEWMTISFDIKIHTKWNEMKFILYTNIFSLTQQ